MQSDSAQFIREKLIIHYPKCNSNYTREQCASISILADKCLQQMELDTFLDQSLSDDEKLKTFTVLNKCLPSFTVDWYRTMQKKIQNPFDGTVQYPTPVPLDPGEHPCGMSEAQRDCLADLKTDDWWFIKAIFEAYGYRRSCLLQVPESCRYEDLDSKVCSNADMLPVRQKQGQALLACIAKNGGPDSPYPAPRPANPPPPPPPPPPRWWW